METVRTVLGREVKVTVVAIGMSNQVVASGYKVPSFTSWVGLNVWHQGIPVRGALFSSFLSSF